jgi:hypothetical protein
MAAFLMLLPSINGKKVHPVSIVSPSPEGSTGLQAREKSMLEEGL